MEQFREQQFRDAVVARLRSAHAAGLPPEQVAKQIAEEQQALATSVADPAVIQAAADAFLLAKQPLMTDPRFATSAEQAHDTMGQILLRRAKEAQANAALLTSPEFCAEMLAASQDVNAPRFATATLEQVKYKELVKDLCGPEATPQVLAHLDAARDGTALTHGALAQAFKPDGALLQPLVDALAKQLPEADPVRLQATAALWLNDREAAAATTVALITNEGAAYKDAVAASKAAHASGPATHAGRALASKAAADLIQL